MIATADDVRDSRIYRVNAWRDLKGRPALTFAGPTVEAYLVFPEADPFRSEPDEADEDTALAPGWWQEDMFSRPSRDYCPRKPWDWRAKQAARWLKPADLAGEVKRALKRSTGIPGGGYAHPGFPPPTAAQYKRWAEAETRPSNLFYYDGTPVTLKPLAVKVKRARKVVAK